jgi:hypothetical protein
MCANGSKWPQQQQQQQAAAAAAPFAKMVMDL